MDLLVARYAQNKPTSVAGFDARGFILGAPVALALQVPFLLIRKKGKMPGALTFMHRVRAAPLRPTHTRTHPAAR